MIADLDAKDKMLMHSRVHNMVTIADILSQIAGLFLPARYALADGAIILALITDTHQLFFSCCMFGCVVGVLTQSEMTVMVSQAYHKSILKWHYTYCSI